MLSKSETLLGGSRLPAIKTRSEESN